MDTGGSFVQARHGGSLKKFIMNHTRTAGQNVTSPASTHHSTTGQSISSAQAALGVIKSLVARNHGPHISAPSHLAAIFLSAGG